MMENDDEREYNIKKSKKDRKEYFQKYYSSRKTPTTCVDCNAEFACASSYKFHVKHNTPCMIKRLMSSWSEAQRQFPEECKSIEPVIQEALYNLATVKDKAT